MNKFWKTINKFLSVFCMCSSLMLLTNCDSAAKKDRIYWNEKAQSYVAKGDYENAEYCYKEELKIADFMGWTGTKVSAIVDITEMKIFKKTHSIREIENDYNTAFLICETTKKCSKVTVYKIYSSRLSFLLFNKKDVIEAKNIFSAIMSDNNTLLMKSEKKEVLTDLSEYLDIAGLKSDKESVLKEIEAWERE